MVLLVSQPSLLSLVVPARELKNLASHARSALQLLLSSLRVPEAIIQGELREMNEVVYARTASRVVLGCMLDLALHVRVRHEYGAEPRMNNLALDLSKVILSPIGNHFPRDVAVGLLSASHPRELVQ
jgi:uncharacterized protein DUF6933